MYCQTIHRTYFTKQRVSLPIRLPLNMQKYLFGFVEIVLVQIPFKLLTGMKCRIDTDNKCIVHDVFGAHPS